MPSARTKSDVLHALESLPDESTLDDAIDRLILLRKVEVGLAQQGQGIGQSDAQAEFAKPQRERSWNRG